MYVYVTSVFLIPHKTGQWERILAPICPIRSCRLPPPPAMPACVRRAPRCASHRLASLPAVRCPRPLGVAVYGHPHQPTSSYELHLVYRDPDYLDQFTLRAHNDTEDELLGALRKRSGAAHGSEVRK